jgi:hypothetical protein
MRRIARAADIKRLEALEAPRAEGSTKGVLLVPPIMPLDAWEALSEPYQRALQESMSEDLGPLLGESQQ